MMKWNVSQQKNGLINFKSELGQINCKSFENKGNLMFLVDDEIIVATLQMSENEFSFDGDIVK